MAVKMCWNVPVRVFLDFMTSPSRQSRTRVDDDISVAARLMGRDLRSPLVGVRIYHPCNSYYSNPLKIRRKIEESKETDSNP